MRMATEKIINTKSHTGKTWCKNSEFVRIVCVGVYRRKVKHKDKASRVCFVVRTRRVMAKTAPKFSSKKRNTDIFALFSPKDCIEMEDFAMLFTLLGLVWLGLVGNFQDLEQV